MVSHCGRVCAFFATKVKQSTRGRRISISACWTKQWRIWCTKLRCGFWTLKIIASFFPRAFTMDLLQRSFKTTDTKMRMPQKGNSTAVVASKLCDVIQEHKEAKRDSVPLYFDNGTDENPQGNGTSLCSIRLTWFAWEWNHGICSFVIPAAADSGNN